MANDKPTTADSADDCDTDERKRYVEQESDGVGKDVNAVDFSNKRVIYEPMIRFDVMSVTCKSFIKFDNISRRQDLPARAASMAP